MALGCSYHGIVVHGSHISKPRNKVFLLPTNQPCKLFIRSSIENKVFEDHSLGIICYKNESGEIICEGYDEGPRFHKQQVVRKTYHHREHQIIDLQIINLLQKQQRFRFVQDSVIHLAEKGLAVLEELDSIALEDNVN